MSLLSVLCGVNLPFVRFTPAMYLAVVELRAVMLPAGVDEAGVQLHALLRVQLAVLVGAPALDLPRNVNCARVRLPRRQFNRLQVFRHFQHTLR